MVDQALKMDAANDNMVDADNDKTVDADNDKTVDADNDNMVDAANDKTVGAANDKTVDATNDKTVDASDDKTVDASDGSVEDVGVGVVVEDEYDEITSKFGPLIDLLDTKGRAKLALEELSGKNKWDTAKALILLGYVSDFRFTTEDFSRMLESDAGRIMELLHQIKLLAPSLNINNAAESLPLPLFMKEEIYRPNTRVVEPVILYFCQDETNKALYEWFSKDPDFLKTFAAATGREPSVHGLHKWMIFDNVKDNELLPQQACFRAVWSKVLEDNELLKELKSFAKFTCVLERPWQAATFERLKALCSLQDRDTVIAGMQSARALRGEAPDKRHIDVLRELLTVSREAFGKVDELTLDVGDALVVRLRHGIQGETTAEALQLRSDLHTSCQRLLGDDHKLTLIAKHRLAVEFKMFGNLVKAQRMLYGMLPELERVFGSDSDILQFSYVELTRIYYEIEGQILDGRERERHPDEDEEVDEYQNDTDDSEESGIDSTDSDFEVLEIFLGNLYM